MTGFLVLEDGTVFRGESVGAAGPRVRRGRLHDRDDRLPGGRHRPELLRSRSSASRRRWSATTASPSSAPSRRAPHARAVVMREARGPEWTDWLHERGIPALTGIDTRSLVLHLRERGAMRGARRRGRRTTSTRRSTAVRAQPSMSGAALAGRVSTREPYVHSEAGDVRVAVVDYGAKRSILRRLAGAGAAVTVFPHDVDADTLAGYDGVLLSNGPGDPEPLVDEVATVARAARPHAGARHLPRPPAARARDRPADVQAARSATAARTTPCVERATGRVLVTSQNHGFAVEATRRPRASRTSRSTTAPSRASPTRSCARARCSSIPRPGPGPHDAWPILGEWVEEVRLAAA